LCRFDATVHEYLLALILNALYPDGFFCSLLIGQFAGTKIFNPHKAMNKNLRVHPGNRRISTQHQKKSLLLFTFGVDE